MVVQTQLGHVSSPEMLQADPARGCGKGHGDKADCVLLTSTNSLDAAPAGRQPSGLLMFFHCTTEGSFVVGK